MAEFISVNDAERLSVIDNFIESSIIEITTGFPGPPGKDGSQGLPGPRGPRGRTGPASQPNEIVKLTGTTTNSSSYILNAGETSLYLKNGSIVSFYASISAYNITDDTAAAFNIEGAAKRNLSGAVSLVGSLNTTNFSDNGMGGVTVSTETDSPNGSFVFVVTGLESKNIIWTGTVFINKA
jgi:hypothetical protein